MLALLCALETQAHAVWYTGNPVVSFRVTRPADDYLDGSVTLTKLRMNACGGGSTDYPVGASIDPVSGPSRSGTPSRPPR
jgi:hypothetical protein